MKSTISVLRVPTRLLVLREKIHDRVLFLVGEEEAALVSQESRHLVKILVVLAGLVASKGQRHDAVLAHEELGVRPRVLAQFLRSKQGECECFLLPETSEITQISGEIEVTLRCEFRMLSTVKTKQRA